jgi:3-ketosteroid 9alpha-monooxygenase subunit B
MEQAVAEMSERTDVFSAELEVALGGSTYSIAWPSDRTLVAIMQEADLNPPFSCLVGKCGACVCTVVEGEAAMDHNEVLAEDDLAENYILGCQSRPVTRRISITFD